MNLMDKLNKLEADRWLTTEEPELLRFKEINYEWYAKTPIGEIKLAMISEKDQDYFFYNMFGKFDNPLVVAKDTGLVFIGEFDFFMVNIKTGVRTIGEMKAFCYILKNNITDNIKPLIEEAKSYWAKQPVKL